MNTAANGDTILKVNGLSKSFDGVPAVEDVSFDVRRSETLGIVGESGSGKTTLVRCILRAIDHEEGIVEYNSRDGWVELQDMRPKELIPLRREMQMIFQDPFASLNPRMTVREILEEPLIVHQVGDRTERLDTVVDMLNHVQLDRDALTRYPHAFSGGQRQRIGIARALILRPDLVVCDESVSALDVSVQAQIINLLEDLQQELGLTYLFVAHDLSVFSTSATACWSCTRAGSWRAARWTRSSPIRRRTTRSSSCRPSRRRIRTFGCSPWTAESLAFSWTCCPPRRSATSPPQRF